MSRVTSSLTMALRRLSSPRPYTLAATKAIHPTEFRRQVYGGEGQGERTSSAAIDQKSQLQNLALQAAMTLRLCVDPVLNARKTAEY